MGFLPVTWQTRDIGFSGTAKARILLQQAPLSEGQGVAAGDDEVVEDLHVHERQSLLEVTGEQLIGLARLRGAGRIGMSEDRGGELRALGVPEAFHLRKLAPCAEQSRESIELFQKLPGELYCAFAAQAGTQQHGKELRIAQY